MAKDKDKERDKVDLRRRFTGSREAPGVDPAETAEYERLTSELAENVGKTVKVATRLGLVVAEAVGLKVMEIVSPTKPAGGTRGGSRGTAASVFASAKEKLPDFNAQTASKLTDLVVGRGFAALRAMQQTVDKTRRQG